MKTKDEFIKSGSKLGRYTKQEVSNELRVVQDKWDASLQLHSESLKEADILTDYLEGEHYSQEMLQSIAKAQRPAEKHNLLARITRLLEGYFNKVVTTTVGAAIQPEHQAIALVHNENFEYLKRVSKWESTRKAIVNDLITTGLGCAGITVEPTGRHDDLGREINKLRLIHIPYNQVLIDFRAKEPDLSDARYLHQWTYLTYDEIERRWGKKKAQSVEMLHDGGYGDNGSQAVNTDTGLADNTTAYSRMQHFEYWKEGNSYFIVTTYERDLDGAVTVTHWHGDYELSREALPISEFPIMAIPLLRKRRSRRWYSPLYEQIPTQDAINQAMLQFQRLLGTERVIADKRAVSAKDLPQLVSKTKVIGETLYVNNIDGLRIENMTNEAQAHINKMYMSIKFMFEEIGINEAFLGESKAGDSGRKFEGQRSASENTLDYIFTPINLMYETVYRRCAHFSSIYKQATEQIRVVDELNQARWKEINKPFLMPTGNYDENGNPEMKPLKTEVYNPTTGGYDLSYVNEESTALQDIDLEIEIHTAPYDDTDATETAFLESVLNGIGGQILATSQPASIMYMYSLLTKNLRTRHSERITKIFTTMAEQMGGFQVEDPRMYMQGGNMGGGAQGANGMGQGSATGASAMGSQGVQGSTPAMGGQGAGKAVLGAAGAANDNTGV